MKPTKKVMADKLKKLKIMDLKNQMQKREIKFRAWYNEQMVYWNLSNMYASDTGELKADQYCQVTDLTNVLALGHFMQFTGLKDKNGKEIYEGDIIKTDVRAGNMKVIYFDTYASFMLEHKGLLYPLNEGADIEVIGSIYQNPELL